MSQLYLLIEYLLIELGVNLALLSPAANQRRELMEIQWLAAAKSRQDWRRDRLVDIDLAPSANEFAGAIVLIKCVNE